MRTLNIGSAAVILAAAVAIFACGPSRNGGDGGPDSGTGCVGICNPPIANKDGGTQSDGGTTVQPDGGTFAYDGGLLTVTLEDLRGTVIPFGAHVKVNDVVVHSVAFEREGTANAWRADFWVSDPANPPYGIYVSKFYSDLPDTYRPLPGDQISIEGYFGTERPYEFPDGYRRLIKNNFPDPELMQITFSSNVTPPAPIVVTAGSFGNADGGSARPNGDHAGSIVYVSGPVEIVDATPQAMQRVSALGEADERYYGFELEGGILVSDLEIDEPNDGGVTCRWREIALDAGTHGQKVVFTGGVQGVWDSYTYPACQDGGTNPFGCFKFNGKVPGTNNNFTNVLYPRNCDDYIGAQVQ